MSESCKGSSCVMSRRQFLFASAAAVTTVMMPMAGCAPVPIQQARLPEQRIARLSDLERDEPIYFNYPDNGPHSQNVLVKLDQVAGGGIGQDKNIVAFSVICTHMGGNLYGTYNAENRSLGPCPMHLSAFDLTRHGLMITGQATESLPQIMLELRGDEIFAVGVMGLVYGQYEGVIARV